MKKTTYLLLLFMPVLMYAQEYEVVTEHPGKESFWVEVPILVHEKTLWGDTWYNPGYREWGDGILPEYFTEKRYNVFPKSADNSWEFQLEIQNLNNDPKMEYHAPNNPTKSMKGYDILWGYHLGLLVEGDTIELGFLFCRGKEWNGLCMVFDGKSWSNWSESSNMYLGGEPSTLHLSTTKNHTNIFWGYCPPNRSCWKGHQLLSFPKHCDGIVYVALLVAPQSKIRVGDATLTYNKAKKAQRPAQSQSKPGLSKKPLTK